MYAPIANSACVYPMILSLPEYLAASHIGLVSSLRARPTSYAGVVSQNLALFLTHVQKVVYIAFCSPHHIYNAIAYPPYSSEPRSLLLISSYSIG